MMSNKEIGIELKKILVEKGISQIDLAERTGLTKIWICNLLNGKRDFNKKTLSLLEKALDIKFEISFKIVRL